MIERIKNKIEMHLSFFDDAETMSHNILKNAPFTDIEAFISMLDNRARLMNIVSGIQTDIEKMLNSIPVEFVTSEFIEYLKGWQQTFEKKIDAIMDIDSKIYSLLENEKSELAREIASVFKNKQAFKGYNLTNVQR